MKPLKQAGRPAARWIWALIVLAALVAGAGLGFRAWRQASGGAPSAAASAQALTTRQARTGSLTLSGSGAVTLVAAQEQELAFTVSGTVDRLNVTVGQQVRQGDVLAQLDGQADLRAEISDAQQNLLTAQHDLAAFQAKAPANLASAQLAVIEAQQALVRAQDGAVQKDWQRCDSDTQERLLDRYHKAVDALTALGDGGGSGDYYLTVLLPQKKVVDQALGAYQACAGYTDYQVASSQASAAAAAAKLQQAQAALDTLTQNAGLDPSGLAAAENQVVAARLALEDAQDALAGATLTAPFDGTVLSVAGKAGDPVEVTSRKPSLTWIILADLAHPRLEFSIDESDLGVVAVGQAAQVIFDAFEDRTFTGQVTRIDPAVGSASGTPSVSGIITLDLSGETDLPAFPKNLSGSVEIIQAQAKDAVLAPLEALHPQADGSYVVYVVGAGGQPVQREVQVGLMDLASAEIVSGLAAGEPVVTKGLP